MNQGKTHKTGFSLGLITILVLLGLTVSAPALGGTETGPVTKGAESVFPLVGGYGFDW